LGRVLGRILRVDNSSSEMALRISNREKKERLEKLRNGRGMKA